MTIEGRIAQRANRAIEEHTFPGCVVGIVKKDGERTVLPFGRLTYEPGLQAVSENTIYDLASITKSIPTASLALTLIQESRLSLDDKVIMYLPELKSDHDATIEDLLRYRVYGPRLSMLKDKSPDEILAFVFEQGFAGPTGESVYTNLPAFLLSIIVERIKDDTLDHLAKKYFFDPFNMPRTGFITTSDVVNTIAPTEVDEWRGEVRGLPHDESAYVFAKAGRAVGHAGLFSTAPDLLNFLEVMIDPDLGHLMSKIAEGAQMGLGWEVNRPWMGHHANPKTFGKTGFTGTSILCDVERGIGLIILSNRTYTKRPDNNEAISSFRSDIADILQG